MPEHEPNRPNYAELKNAQQEQQHETGPDRPEKINRAVSWPDSPDMVSQQTAAHEQSKANNQRLHEQQPDWVKGLKYPEYLEKMQQQREQEQAAQRGNEGPQIDPTAR